MDIATLPNFTPLVKDYLTRFDRSPVRDFFAVGPNAPHEQLRALLDRRLTLNRSRPQEFRTTVARAIRELHATIGDTHSATANNIARIESADTFGVVTGQQTGILGGPLYTFYKAFTAVELAKRFGNEFPEFSFVPMFWIETEDHDFEEISSVAILDAEGHPKRVRYVPESLRANPGMKWQKQAGPMQMESAPLGEFFQELSAALSPSNFSREVLELFQHSYREGHTFAEAFAGILNACFAEDGLLLVDANRRELKMLGRDLFRQEIESTPGLSERIVLQSKKLEQQYHAQVKPRALNLFYLTDESERVAINEVAIDEKEQTEKERTFFLQGTRKTFTRSELIAEAERHPERFSPNVVMRPLYQDTLLPTVAYVAGPGEIAYFAQFMPAYEWADLPMPLIFPRVTLTLIEERLERILSKYRVTPEDVLSNAQAKSTALLDQAMESDVAPQFEHAIEEIDGILESLRPMVVSADATLDGALTSLKGKVLTAVRDFQNKTLASERKRHATTKAQLDKLLAALLPNSELQERELNLVYLLNKYGVNFIDLLKSKLAVFSLDFSRHHILHLNEMGTFPTDGVDRRTSVASEPLSSPVN